MEVPIALAERTVLVLLSQRPAHGFAVSQLTAPDGELGRIWRIPRPIVYRAIGRLLAAPCGDGVDGALGAARRRSAGCARRSSTSGISGRTC